MVAMRFEMNWGLSMNRGIGARNLFRELPAGVGTRGINSALRPNPWFMAPTRVQDWNWRLSLNAGRWKTGWMPVPFLRTDQA